MHIYKGEKKKKKTGRTGEQVLREVVRFSANVDESRRRRRSLLLRSGIDDRLIYEEL